MIGLGPFQSASILKTGLLMRS